MTVLDNFWPVTGVSVSQAQVSQMWRNFATDGVVRGALNGFGVTQRAAGANMSVDVATGDAILAGIYAENGVIKNLVVTANGGGATRQDYVVIRVEFATPDVIVYVAPGDGAGNPPSLLSSGTFWDVAIAQIRVTVGAVTITNADITSLLWNQYTPGWRDQHLGVDVLRPNLLVNGGFEINQRGGTVTANLAYAHDRWQFLTHGGTSTIAITDEIVIIDSVGLHSMKCAYIQGNANSSIDQLIEDYASLRGKTISFSIRVRQGVAASVKPYIQDTGSVQYGATSLTTGAFTTLTFTRAISTTATSVTVGVDLTATDTVYLDSAMLVVSQQPTTFVTIPTPDDRNRTFRYYQQWGGDTAGDMVGAGQCYSTTQSLHILPHPPFGGPPSWTASAAGDFVITDATSVTKTVTVLAFTNPSKRGVRLDATIGSASLVAGNATLMFGGSANARLNAAYSP